MVNIEGLLSSGEHLIGHYSVEIARRVDGMWTGTVPPLYATLTDRRLILQPQTRRRYEPAIIPRRAITAIREFDEAHAGRRRHGVVLYLLHNPPISLLAAGQQGEDFIDQLTEIYHLGILSGIRRPDITPPQRVPRLTTRRKAQITAQVAPCPLRFDNRVEMARLRRLIARVQAI